MNFLKKYPIFSKLLIMLLLGILSVIIPLWSIKIIIFLAGVFVFSTIIKRGAIAFIILVLIFSLPTTLTIKLRPFSLNNFIENFSQRRLQNYQKNIIYPDTNTELFTDEVLIDMGNSNLILEFTDGNNISYSSKLKIEQGKTIKISTNKRNNYSFYLKIGTESLKYLKINANNVKLSGKATLNELKINATAISFNSLDIECENLKLNGTGINIDGKINSKFFEIDGTGINIDGYISGKNFNLNGTGINIDSKINYEEIRIDGTGMNIDIKLGRKNTYTKINATTIIGSIDISNNPAQIKILCTSGNIKIKNYKKAVLDVKGPRLTFEQE
ncbi:MULTISPECIES: hypothetical protein [unclassified Thermosipho (in: thermotogales)]|uniref:hypothetical protein n=1 Tax=unclassified Thermosipho (in: thermotogales) TaxID=2676525 RepID=UPI000985439C|nr:MULTISPECIES: hypothetical protein [unclassified Thermosipho (in: thermotogales)]MBT1247489.1 hypothetical protein [Thermosipho sp. 1244]OOC46263.1 hypothetical protein XO09_07580 [Thermosipho sp. 1223]